MRNYKKIQENLGKHCIYIKTVSRDEVVAFTGRVHFFGGNLILLIPRENVLDLGPLGRLDSATPIEQIVSLLNGKSFRKNYTYSGRFKIGQRILSKVLLSSLFKDIRR